MAFVIGERLLRDTMSEEPAWRGLAGPAGTALAFGALGDSTGDARYWDAANRQLAAAARADDVPSIGLFSGISGLRAVAAIFSRSAPHLQKLVDQCDAYVESKLPALDDVRVADMDAYDLISGWSGARLARCVLGPKNPDRLVGLLAWLMADDDRWCKVHPLRKDDPPENDIGLAHGIAGALAAIALTTTDVQSDLRSLLERQAAQLVSHCFRNNGSIGWSFCLQATTEPMRPAWCYGGAGVAAALYSVARLLGDKTLETFSLDALEGVAALAPSDWGHRDFAICHGTLGNALVLASVGAASQRPSLLTATGRAIEYALDGLERDGGACFGLDFDMQVRDLPGELDGAAGIALALLTLCGDTDSIWLRLHALMPLKR